MILSRYLVFAYITPPDYPRFVYRVFVVFFFELFLSGVVLSSRRIMAPSSDDKGRKPMEEDHQDLKLKEEHVAGGSMSWEFRDSSHGEAYRRGSTEVTMGPAQDCAYRDTSVYPGSGPSRL
jgi:hypothetical protein